MKSFLKLLAVGLFACSISTLPTSDAVAQSRDFSAERILLDDGAGGTLTISYTGPGDSQFEIPPGPSTTVEPGTLAGQTLRWNGTEWVASSTLTNDGVTVSTTGALAVGGTISGNGSGITNIDAANIATGSLDLARISTTGADEGEALTYTGGALAYANPAAGSLVLPFSQTSNIPNTLFTLTSTTLADGVSTARFVMNSESGLGSALVAETNSSGNALYAVSTGLGAAIMGETFNDATAIYGLTQSLGSAGLFQNNGGSNTSPTLLALNTNGSGPAVRVIASGSGKAGEFTIDNGANTSDALTASTSGSGIAVFGYTNGTGGNAGRFQVDNATNNLSAIWASTNGTGRAATIEILNSSSSATALRANTNGSGFALYGYTNGTSNAARIEIENNANSTTALWSSTNGTGRAGLFQITNAANSAAAVSISTTGTGPALQLTSGGFVGTYQALGSGTISTGSVTVLINAGAGTPAVNPPASGTNGQIMVVCTDDADGATITGIGSIPAGGCVTMARVGGAWRITQ